MGKYAYCLDKEAIELIRFWRIAYHAVNWNHSSALDFECHGVFELFGV